jgi:hypothetical protein
MLLVLLAIFSVTLLSLAAVQVAAAPMTQEPPMVLPSGPGLNHGQRASGSENWIVGGLPGAKTARIAASAGATPISARLGSYSVPRDKASRLARRLKKSDRLIYAEPDVNVSPAGYPPDLLFDQQKWLNRIVSPNDVTPPTVRRKSPLIAIIEESIDPLHPDLLAARLTGAKSIDPAADTHGTSIAGIIGSPGEMMGIRGVWPGARMRLFPSGLKCSTTSKAVQRAVNKGAAVINMSYTFPADDCFTHFKATQYAIRKGSLPVAAAGNTGASGNAAVRPATDPHVISVAAVNDSSIVAPFSTRNPQVDITAPGVDVLAPVVSAQMDSAGNSKVVRGWDYVNGTSFSTPMVSATAAWLMQVRPELGNLQISSLLTGSATDLGEPGRDPEYGEGLLSIEESLTAPVPVADPYEPNDDIKWANGSLIGLKTPYLWRAGKGKRRILTASLSRAKDPADVYRVMIPRRRRIFVNVSQLEGDVVLSALKPKARTIYGPRSNLIVRSDRSYPKTEGILVRNLKKKPQAIWLAITPSPNQAGNDSRYRIKVVRK